MNFPASCRSIAILLSALSAMGQLPNETRGSDKGEPKYKPSAIIESARHISENLKSQGKKLPCTTFVQEVLQKLEIKLSAEEIASLQIRGIGEASVADELAAGNPAMRGGPGMLIDKGIAEAVNAADAKPGDIIQYWYRDPKKSGGIGGHTGVVQGLLPDGKVSILDSNIKRGPGQLALDLKTKLHATVARLK